MPWKEIMGRLPKETAERIVQYCETILEIRMRAGQCVELVCMDGIVRIGSPVSAQEMRKIALSMMDYSYHAREDELARGYFTLRNGCRIGVGGAFIYTAGCVHLRAIGSLCIRIAREVKGCAEALTDEILKKGFPVNTMICSSPGLGKTTLLRDAARILSNRGYTVGIADERHEIAACRDGIPSLDVGMRTDVIDGCPKGIAMEMLTRSMSPQILITDEIGGRDDIEAIRDAARRGVAVITSAHASGLDELQGGPLKHIFKERLFERIVFLKGTPGHIQEIFEL